MTDSAKPRYWKTRVDCWYEPHRDPGKKQKPPQRVVRHVIQEAATSEDAIANALEWAEKTADCSKGRRWIGFEHRFTGSIKFPLEVAE